MLGGAVPLPKFNKRKSVSKYRIILFKPKGWLSVEEFDMEDERYRECDRFPTLKEAKAYLKFIIQYPNGKVIKEIEVK